MASIQVTVTFAAKNQDVWKFQADLSSQVTVTLATDQISVLLVNLFRVRFSQTCNRLGYFSLHLFDHTINNSLERLKYPLPLKSNGFKCGRTVKIQSTL